MPLGLPDCPVTASEQCTGKAACQTLHVRAMLTGLFMCLAQALTNFGQSFQQLPGQLQNAAKMFQVQSQGVPVQAPMAGPLAPAGSYGAQAAP